MSSRKPQGQTYNGTTTVVALSPAAAAVAQPAEPAPAPRPALPAGIEEAFLPVKGAAEHITYRPSVHGTARLHYADKALGVDEWQTVSVNAALSDDGQQALWEEGEETAAPLTRTPAPRAGFADLPAGAQRAANYASWGKSLAAQLYQARPLQLWTCDALNQTSRAGESEGDFRSRLALAVREARDAESEKLRQKFAPKLATLQGQRQRALERVEREKGQASQQKMQAAISLGTSILGAFLGRKMVSATNVGRIGTAAKSASRIGRESADVDRAEESVEQIDQRIADLNKELEAAIAQLDTRLDAQRIALRELSLAPRKSDVAVGKVLLLWTPWRIGADGFPANAS
jgi:hypothetical protein